MHEVSGFGRRFDWSVFIAASLLAAVILVLIVGIPQWLSKEARWELLRSRIGEIARLAANAVDGDLHRRLLDPANYDDALYSQALEPLVRIHSANPSIYYLYTMMERDGAAYFILDTAASPRLRTERQLRASAYMERFDLREEYKDDWLQQLAAGKTYVNPTFQEDDYGYFLSGHAPIFDRNGNYSGFAGVDFDLGYYHDQERHFRNIAAGSLAAGLTLSLLIGYLAAFYHSEMSRRLRELHELSIRDSLTGLLNRRGVMQFIKPALELSAEKSALLLVDVDNLERINNLHGHVAGDIVLTKVAAAIRESLPKGDECGRLGDDFLIFAADCDLLGATDIARRILARTSSQEMPLAGARFTVSIGIATHQGAGADFARMYREADTALRQARAEATDRIAVFGPSTAGTSQSHRLQEDISAEAVD